MRNSNEKRPRIGDRRREDGASRDGFNREGGERRSFDRTGRPSYGNREEGHSYRPRTEGGEGRSFRPRTEGGENRPYRPRPEGGDNRPYRPRTEGGENRSYRPRTEGDDNRSFRPRTEGGDNRSYRPRPEGGESRPYRPRTEGDDNRSFRPRFEGGERRSDNRGYGDRPYRSQDNRGENRGGGAADSRGDRPYKPRFERSNSEGGYRSDYGNRQPRKYDDTYNPNDKYSKKKQFEYKKQFTNPNEPVRLNKFLANAGICSRREADEYIQAGVITVNGNVVSELGVKVVPATDKVLFHDQLVRSERKVYILLNKPKDCVTTVEDTHDRLTVLDLVKNACSERVYPVGRLDRNTTGVLLITNDGDLASKLTHPKYDKKKIYHVVLDKDITQEELDSIAQGITLEDGDIKADDISYIKEGDYSQIGIEIHSGKNRIVRRIFEHLGYKVIRLDRVLFAGLTKKNLPRGKWRFLSESEVNMLKMSN